jgi:chromatin remodeling complex protein RSC6
MSDTTTYNETVPSETVPSETVPSETVPSETVPSETVSTSASGEAAATIETQFELLQQNLTKIQQQLRTLEKTVKKETKKRESSVAVKAPTMRQSKIIGFDVQEKLIPTLCAFMNLPPESTSTRNNVTSYITQYICQHKLQDMTDRKCIHLNSELTALFQLETTPTITYFSLHKHMSKLFVRA